MARKKVALIENAPDVSEKMVSFLAEMGYIVKVCDDPKQAIPFTVNMDRT
ncbi:MAG: hypothetical protein M5R36_02340 [Deltaproteobacteria bacterium]|nr:hypothetical protein [Deltaproteobacteria bacterium]